MGNISRPLVALLVATVAFFALWLVALRPSSPSTSSGSSGLGRYQSAINAAHRAVNTSTQASAAEGGSVASGSAGAAVKAASAPAAAASRATASAPPTGVHVPAARHRFDVATRALRENKVLALLFYNPPGADDQAVKQELAAVPTYGGKVVKLAVPVNELARYAVVTNQVPVTVSPTLVLIDSKQQATTIVGFADQFEIDQRVLDALSVR